MIVLQVSSEFLKIMRLKDLESALQEIKLEQYNTTSHLASRMVFTAHSNYDDIEGKIVADFGIGSNLLDSSHNVALDIDESAINIANKNIKAFDVEIDLVITDLKLDPLDKYKKKIDTVIMNPPFGTKNNKGIDLIFLKKAIEISTTSVYSLHKSSTREHIIRKAKEWNVNCEVLAEMKFDVPKMYNFHKQKSVDIEVDFLRFEIKEN
ncbi:9313_t:CDS:2 [Entrophospora sp. SA101]|nr:5003_t:CDS:2 [Entrophospora sp. SA101]CAJ0755163.1 9313_t:CDS:2 [Entrophospora sp. SA101]CAJ0832677.1 9903_t:CDS:2 [Entrophospora sp. SA101]CAJ0912214.1 15407_t:CDS:2 [Entrophospora sp. SA101]